MQGVVGSLVVNMVTRNSAFKAGMREGGASVKHFKVECTELQHTVKELAGEVGGGLGSKIASALFSPATAGVGAIIGAVHAVMHLASEMKELEHAAHRIGIDVVAFQEMGVLARKSGTDIGDLSTSVIRLQKNLGEAAHGKGAARDVLEEMGLDPQKLARLSPDEAFVKVAQAIAKVHNRADRARIEVELFGRSGGQLDATINRAADGLERFQHFAVKESGVRAMADASEAIADTWNMASTYAKNFFATVAFGYQEIGKHQDAILPGFRSSNSPIQNLTDAGAQAIGLGTFLPVFHGDFLPGAQPGDKEAQAAIDTANDQKAAIQKIVGEIQAAARVAKTDAGGDQFTKWIDELNQLGAAGKRAASVIEPLVWWARGDIKKNEAAKQGQKESEHAAAMIADLRGSVADAEARASALFAGGNKNLMLPESEADAIGKLTRKMIELSEKSGIARFAEEAKKAAVELRNLGEVGARLKLAEHLREQTLTPLQILQAKLQEIEALLKGGQLHGTAGEKTAELGRQQAKADYYKTLGVGRPLRELDTATAPIDEAMKAGAISADEAKDAFQKLRERILGVPDLRPPLDRMAFAASEYATLLEKNSISQEEFDALMYKKAGEVVGNRKQFASGAEVGSQEHYRMTMGIADPQKQLADAAKAQLAEAKLQTTIQKETLAAVKDGPKLASIDN